MRLLMLCIVPIMMLLLSSCAMLQKCPVRNSENKGISEADALKIHNFGYRSYSYKKSVDLSEKQIKNVEKHGISLTPEERCIDYIRIVKQKSAGKIGGSVFSVKGEGEFGNYELLVCVHSNKLIKEIYVKNNPLNGSGSPVLETEFLDQFVDRTLEKSFEFREKIDDYLYSPTKLASIKNAPVTSRDIALRLKKLLVIAQATL